MGHQDGGQVEAFCALIGAKGSAIESIISDILDENHHSTLVDTAKLTLSEQKLDSWRETVVNAPSSTQLKLQGGNYISFAGDLISGVYWWRSSPAPWPTTSTVF